MRIVGIIQARMSSSRLKGKVLMNLAGRPVLWHVVNRIQSCQSLSETVVATSVDDTDDAIEAWCNSENTNCFRGSLEDVLDRYYHAARSVSADVIVRITSDCPVIDPDIVDEVVYRFIKGNYDYYGLSGEFPDGLDCTAISFNALERAWEDANLMSEREHVGPYIEKNPELFRLGGYEKFTGLGHHRWTLDEKRDYQFLKEIFDRLFYQDSTFHAEDILKLLEKEPELIKINSKIKRNEGYLKSIMSEENDNV